MVDGTPMCRKGLFFAMLLLLLGCEPQDRRPGLWLSGQVAPIPEDWGFANEYPEIFVETRTWYGIPHSVTTVVATTNGKLYVPSIYDEAIEFPGTKFWNENIAADPDVRLKIGDKIYELRAHLVEDADEYRVGFRALAAKYPFWQQALEDETKRPPFVVIRMDPR
jgi:hypothetical protein